MRITTSWLIYRFTASCQTPPSSLPLRMPPLRRGPRSLPAWRSEVEGCRHAAVTIFSSRRRVNTRDGGRRRRAATRGRSSIATS